MKNSNSNLAYRYQNKLLLTDADTECEHCEHDHFVCLDCGAELEPSDFGDEDYGQER